MKNFYTIAVLVASAFLFMCGCKYETVTGDPTHTRIHTLDNGLKIYMNVNRDEPRLQAYIAVRSGSKDDPADNTGLAHYLEHIMFKGTESFGTSDYAAEKPLLDEIERLFEEHKESSDQSVRKAIYHKIDSVSYLASQIAIPNEYDKLMAAIGAQGSNAFTSNDVTCYTENIPSNRIEDWARIQSDRFKNLVIRGFHTELETVYEEYNMYLNEDSENAMMAMDSVLFKKHPYGLQSTIGTSEHLKSPSITAIKKQKAKFYVPNNVAICVSGDFDPDEFVAVVKKYFGDWERNDKLELLTYEDEDPIDSPVVKDVYGTDAEFVMMGWRLPGEKDGRSEAAEIVGAVLQNGKAGLVDLDINQRQTLLGAQAEIYGRTDYSELIMAGYPKSGQTLEEVKDILLAEIRKLCDGDFDETLITAAIANAKLARMRSLENSRSIVMSYVNSFIAGHDWAYDVTKLDRLSKLTKQDVVEWANTYFNDNNYVVVYKRQGPNPRNEKIVAPAIIPIATNREKTSEFLAEIQNSAAGPIEPVFVDYLKDMSKFPERPGVEVLYKHNDKNDITQVNFRYDGCGLSSDPALSLAFEYLEYLGTADKSREELSVEEYQLACNHSFNVTDNTFTYSVSGLNENIPAALGLVENMMLNALPDETVLESLKMDKIKGRMMAKLNQSACNAALRDYIFYGPEYAAKMNLTDREIMDITSGELLDKVRNVLGYAHRVLYYGPDSESDVKAMLDGSHYVPAELKPLEKTRTVKALTTEPKVYIAPYDSRQFNYIQASCRGEQYSIEDAPAISLYNSYFGGGMNTIVFQEMREARGLAYSARAMLSSPSYADDTYLFYATIGSQNDKLRQAVEAFDMIINDMPESQKAFDIAKTSVEAVLRTTRVNGMAVLNNYIQSEELGLTEPIGKYVFEHLSDLTIDDLMECQRKWVKGRSYVYGLLGNEGLDRAYLKTLGPVQELSLEEIFGY